MQPLRDRNCFAVAIVLLVAWGAPLGAQDDAPVAAPATADRNGVMATALQPGVARGDFEFYVDALSQSPAGTGQTLVRCVIQLPVGVILDQTKANKADLRLRVRAYEAQAALLRLEAAAANAPKTKDPKTTQAESARAASARGDEAADDLWDPLESTCRHASLSIL